MLLLGQARQRTCQGMTRRAFLQVGASSVLGLSMADLLKMRAATGSSPAGPARAVIFLWLWGGPSQLDTWDPKPNASVEFRGPFATIPTRMTGVRVCELFPQVAAITNHLAILRSLHTQSNDHGVAGTVGLLPGLAITGLEHSLHIAMTVVYLVGLVRFVTNRRCDWWWIICIIVQPLIRFEAAGMIVAAAIAAGASLNETLELANAAASVVIHKLGTTGTASIGELEKLLTPES